jgi:hypothetical protein
MNEYERLGVTPTPDNGKRTGAELVEPLARLGFYSGQV